MKNYIVAMPPGTPVFWIGWRYSKLIEAGAALLEPADDGRWCHVLSSITVSADSVLAKYKASKNFVVSFTCFFCLSSLI